ncbi:MAG: TraR/DksA C4-type zinc finger protein [Puniceicoccales bacterium]|nr:TraR/DksA C4-type zinc finger protein [Puniceicoccales bacterium]
MNKKSNAADINNMALDLLRAVRKRNKTRKIDSAGTGFFSMADVDHILSQKKNLPVPSTPQVPKKPVKKPSRETPKGKKVSPPSVHTHKRILKPASLGDILGKKSSSSLPAPIPMEDERKVPEAFRSYYRSLDQLRHKLKLGISSLAKSSLQETSGNLARYNTLDNGSDYSAQEITLTVVSNEKEMLDEVEAAIRRIFDGTYGLCEITGKPIPKKRLEAVPFTRHSIEGQQKIEEMKKARRSMTNITNTIVPTEEKEEASPPFSTDDADEET